MRRRNWERYTMPGGHIATCRGTEGPGHDPYSFTEYEVRRSGRPLALLHLGLGTYSEVDGVDLDEYDEPASVARFEQAAGLTLREITKIIDRADMRRNARCPWGDWRRDPMGSLSDYE